MCTSFPQYFHFAWRRANEQSNIPHKSIDTLSEKVVSTLILPTSPVCGYGDFCCQFHFMRNLEIDGFTAFHHGVQITRPSCFYAHTIVVVGTMWHRRDKLCQHKVVPIRSCTCQRLLPSPIY